MFKGFRIAASGMSAQRVRLNLVSSNLANANTTRTEEGGPYKRLRPVFSTLVEGASEPDTPDAALRGVEVVEIDKDEREGALVHNPSHPDADEDGNVRMPNVNVMEEMVDMMTASRSFEANVQAFTSLKEMVVRSLDIGR
tara:strand:+ start:979 stop:1398 length:420 start_codon:yes stop_codon:yes gene_type:complete